MPEGVRVSDVVSVGGFRSAAAYLEGASAAPVGSATMTRIVVASCLRAPTATSFLWSNWQNAPRGWAWLATTTGFTFRITDGGPATGDLVLPVGLWRKGRLFVLVGAYDGTTLRAQYNALVAATPSANAGATAGTQVAVVGARPAFYSGPLLDLSVGLVMGTDLVALSAANMAIAVTQITEDLENGRDPSPRIEALLGGTPADYLYYNAADAISGSGAVKPTWVPRVGANTLTKTGNLQAFSTQARLV